MNVLEIIVDEIPESCGKCCLMRYINNDVPICFGIPDGKNEITGNPYNMNYRRSDCPLVERKCTRKPISLDDLELSVRARNCLRRHGVTTVEELKNMSDEELHRVRNLGQRCIDEIKEKLGGI